MNNIPTITNAHFETKQGKDASYIMAFDNGQIVYCYGHSFSEEARQKLIEKCENYYLKHPNINAYEVHTRPISVVQTNIGKVVQVPEGFDQSDTNVLYFMTVLMADTNPQFTVLAVNQSHRKLMVIGTNSEFALFSYDEIKASNTKATSYRILGMVSNLKQEILPFFSEHKELIEA